jgi:hypothetical protein
MHICASQSLFSHSYVVNECLNRHCNVQIDIGIRADELGIDPKPITIYPGMQIGWANIRHIFFLSNNEYFRPFILIFRGRQN